MLRYSEASALHDDRCQILRDYAQDDIAREALTYCAFALLSDACNAEPAFALFITMTSSSAARFASGRTVMLATSRAELSGSILPTRRF